MDRYLLTIRSADDLDAPPLLATSDPGVLAAVAAILTDRLQGRERRRVLALARDTRPEDGGS